MNLPPMDPESTGTMRWLLKKSPLPGVITDLERRPDDEDTVRRHPMPAVQMAADAFERVVCICNASDTPEPFFEGCGTTWNTFSTRGRCPGCAHQWRWTSCLRCEGWSLHDDWVPRKVRGGRGPDMPYLPYLPHHGFLLNVIGASKTAAGARISHRRSSIVVEATTTLRRSSKAAAGRPAMSCAIARVNHP